MELMHKDYGHLGWPGLMRPIKYQEWWPSTDADVKGFLQYCPACQIARGPLSQQQKEPNMPQARDNIAPFKRWSIDLVEILPKMPNGIWWIITAINFAIGWPVAKAVWDATDKTIADFVHKDIFISLWSTARAALQSWDKLSKLSGGLVSCLSQDSSSNNDIVSSPYQRQSGKPKWVSG